jgi:hypothetical protein
MHRRDESSWGQNAENNVKLAQKPNPEPKGTVTEFYCQFHARQRCQPERTPAQFGACPGSPGALIFLLTIK